MVEEYVCISELLAVRSGLGVGEGTELNCPKATLLALLDVEHL